jgi:hypothetical protein
MFFVQLRIASDTWYETVYLRQKSLQLL